MATGIPPDTIEHTQRPAAASISVTVKNLAKYGLSKHEIAKALGRTRKSIDKYQKEFDEGEGHIIKRLRETQLDVALNDRNVAMLIHLGKFFLGQKEKTQLEISKPDETLKDVPTEELIALVSSGDLPDGT